MPGSPERVLGRNPNVTPGAIAATRERWGLDKPVIPDQLVAYLAATAQGDLGFSFVVSGPAGRRRPGRPDLAHGDPVRPGRDHRDRPRGRSRRVHGLATRRPRRSPGQRGVAGPLRDALLPDRDDVAARLRRRSRLVPDLRDVRRGCDLQRLYRPADRLPVTPRAPAGDGRARVDRPVCDRDALIDRRDAGRGVHHDGPGQGHPRPQHPATPRHAQRDAPDGDAHRDQPGIRRRRRHHGRGRLQLAGPRDPDGRRPCRPRLSRPAGHLPDPVRVGRRWPTSSPISATSSSTRGSRHDLARRHRRTWSSDTRGAGG